MANKRKHRGGGHHADVNSPPYLSFDPGLEAQRRAAQRGLADTRQDIRTERHRGKRDLHQQLHDIKTQFRRGRYSTRTQLQSGLIGVRQGRQDVRLQESRGMEDFGHQLDLLTRHYTQLASGQTQAASAAGVADRGTLAASAEKRASNESVDRYPIDVGEQRLSEDTGIALSRLGLQEHLLRSGAQHQFQFLRQDFRHDTGLAHQGFRRTRRDLYRQLQRAKREQRIGDVATVQQEIYEARQNQPGAFDPHGRRV